LDIKNYEEQLNMKEFIQLSKKDKLNIFNQTSERSGLPSYAVEKDWWVTLSLNIIFSLPYANHIVFKGGTSLSKAWNLIERFSEDIDLVTDRKHLGFEGDLSKIQVKKLRKASCSFIETGFYKDINNELIKLGVQDYELIVQETKDSDTDPLIIELRYESLTEESKYTGFIKESAISFGGHIRVGDAFIPSVLLEIANFGLGISYDVNISGLKKVSYGKGGFEISLRYINPSPFRYGRGTKSGSMF